MRDVMRHRGGNVGNGGNGCGSVWRGRTDSTDSCFDVVRSHLEVGKGTTDLEYRAFILLRR